MLELLEYVIKALVYRTHNFIWDEPSFYAESALIALGVRAALRVSTLIKAMVSSTLATGICASFFVTVYSNVHVAPVISINVIEICKFIIEECFTLILDF